MKFRINEEIFFSNKMRLKDAENELQNVSFTVNRNQNRIILFGKTWIFNGTEAYIDLYFNHEELLEDIILTIYPSNYAFIQNSLINEYGEPTKTEENGENYWEIDNGIISHGIKDRFGDLEFISVRWNN